MTHKHTLHQSFGYAFAGIIHAVRENRNLRIHFIIAIAVFVLSIYLKVAYQDLAILIVLIVLVIAAEMINTSLEEMTDLITSEHRQEAKVAKDVAAGMVLVASIGAALVGALILGPYVLPSFI
ncbi:MAG: hypothetical protein A2776_00765 [Candidatus Levybacteria bacterium RIFCSPHIGHO2_01_FULL_40_10]|nr:MAG: hypothetical protein A2776_00765 [Candidatus Levybacteria bacterium RIFCSPHIGHO2_01_FULL_40_10]